MRKKLFLSYLIIIVVCLLGAYISIWNQGYRYIQEKNEESFLNRAFLLADEIEEQSFKTKEDLLDYIMKKAKKFELRITVMDLTGTVIADSIRDPKSMENHGTRKEVKEAIQTGSSSLVRYSDVLKEKCHYGAVRFKSGNIEGILRLSTPLLEYQAIWEKVLQTMIAFIFIAVVISIGLAIFFTRKMIKPIELVTDVAEKISNGDYGAMIQIEDQDQIGRLAQSFNRMSENMRKTMEDLNSRNLELENFSEMRKQFVSNVTHELKTPLTSIRGFVDTLKNGALEDKEYAEHFLDIIDIEAKRLGTLIQDILVLSEMESGESVQGEKMMCDMKEIWEEVEELLEGKSKTGVHLFGEFQENLPLFYGNSYRLKEIVLNLTDNALTYTERGYVRVRCFQEDNDLVIEVKDTGIGIAKEHLLRLFERFYRVDKGRSRKQGGTGLGLSIVKHIVELYDGTIQVESVVEEGSCFTVRLPYQGGNIKENRV